MAEKLSGGVAGRAIITPGFVVSVLDRAQEMLAYRLVRAPAVLIRRTTVRTPIVIDGQTLDERTQHVLAVLARSGRPPLDQQMVFDARLEYTRLPLILEDPVVALPRVEDATIPGPGGHIPIRIFAPRSGPPAMPVLVYFHGGGGVIGDLDTHDGLCRMLARAIDCVVVSVAYRLGPEAPFPAGTEDAFVAFRWAARNASDLGADASRVAVGGDSMGGCLAAVVSQLARDAGREQPFAQLLLYPATDRVTETRSRRLFGQDFLLTESLLQWFMDHYLAGADPTNPRVSPLMHSRLDDLPPAVVVTAGFDPLRDEGKAYADAMSEAGVKVRYRCHEGLIHGFAQMTGAVPTARQAILEAARELAALFDGG